MQLVGLVWEWFEGVGEAGGTKECVQINGFSLQEIQKVGLLIYFLIGWERQIL